MAKDEIVEEGSKTRGPVRDECKEDPQAIYERRWKQVVRLREEKVAAGGPQAWDLPDDEIMAELREIRRQMWEERNGAKSREPQACLGSDDALSTPKP